MYQVGERSKNISSQFAEFMYDFLLKGVLKFGDSFSVWAKFWDSWQGHEFFGDIKNLHYN